MSDIYLLSPGLFTGAVKCSPDALPDFTTQNLYHYVLNNPSNYTQRDLKAYRSLHACQHFVSQSLTNFRQWTALEQCVHNLT